MPIIKVPFVRLILTAANLIPNNVIVSRFVSILNENPLGTLDVLFHAFMPY